MDINSSTELATAVTSNVAIRTAAQLEIFGPPRFSRVKVSRPMTLCSLQLGDGGTIGSILGNIVNNSVLVINRSNAFEYAGVISGTGALQQIGTGTTTLTGQQHLYRRDHGQRRHVAGERLDRLAG